MNIVIHPKLLQGTVEAIASKSQTHRLLICSAFADKETDLVCKQTNQDISATAACLNALGAHIEKTQLGYHVVPVTSLPQSAILPCGESGSTLRFLLPVVGALGVEARFQLEGRLGKRPLSALWEVMAQHGCKLHKPDENTIHLTGCLTGGNYTIAGNVSSQYITGLLLASVLIQAPCSVTVTGQLESAPYVRMTHQAMELFGIHSHSDFDANTAYRTPGTIRVEGDWSNAAFFLAAKQLGNPVSVTGLNPHSAQGDKAVLTLLEDLRHFTVVDGRDVPDLIPILAVYSACHQGAEFANIGRLRLKESDRMETVSNMLRQLGCKTEATHDCLKVYPSSFGSCVIDAANDHRIAMAAAIAATKATGPITIIGAQCVSKSYPDFWDVYKQLGGCYEQHIR